jgi:hypothetical protein
MRTSGFRNIFAGGAGGGGGGLTDGKETGLTPGFSCDDEGLPAGFASGYPQNPQNAVPSGLSLPHCPHAGIRSPSLPYQNFRGTSEQGLQLSPAPFSPHIKIPGCATGHKP